MPHSKEGDGAERRPRRKRASEATGKPRTRTLVLVPVWKCQLRASEKTKAFPQIHTPENRLAEAVGLAKAIDLDVIDAEIVPLSAPRPSTLLGSGKVEELRQRVGELDIGLVVIDHVVTPVQQRNLENAWNTKVLDRTGLILEIFGARARTREGVLQVELAHLTYQKGRLVRAWTHLERQRGGSGFLGGPGEAQIELDRRILQDRIDAIKRDLAEVVKLAICTGRADARCLIRSSPSSAIQMPVNRRFSTRSPAPASLPWIRCSRRSTRRCAK